MVLVDAFGSDAFHALLKFLRLDGHPLLEGVALFYVLADSCRILFVAFPGPGEPVLTGRLPPASRGPVFRHECHYKKMYPFLIFRLLFFTVDFHRCSTFCKFMVRNALLH